MSALEHQHTMTVPEYVRATEQFGWEATELIEGVVYSMPAEKNRHRMTVKTVQRALDVAFPSDDVSTTGSVELDPQSLVEPDVFVIDGDSVQDPDGYVPCSTVLLVVEVSVSTLRYDLGPKLKMYAKTAIPEVWVIDPGPDAGWLERHTQPAEGRYLSVERFEVGENARDLNVAEVRAGG